MSAGRGTTGGRAIARVLAVFALVLGVLALHSSGHDLNVGSPAMAAPAAGSTAAALTEGSLAAAAHQHTHADDHSDHFFAAAAAHQHEGASGHHAGHADAEACLALLTAAIALVLAVRRTTLAGGTTRPTAGPARPRAPSVLPGQRGPSLSALCVLRT